MWKKYSDVFGHKHDFEVKYRIFSKEEGNTQRFFQGIRCDFKYADYKESDIYMIHPEFLDFEGNVWLDTSKEVNHSGFARMWVVMPQMRELHRKRIKIGVKGYFVCGVKKIGEMEVIKIVDLFNNPIID